VYYIGLCIKRMRVCEANICMSESGKRNVFTADGKPLAVLVLGGGRGNITIDWL